MSLSILGSVIMVGTAPNNPLDQLINQAQRASTLDLITTLQTLGISPIIVATPEIDWLSDTPGIIVEKDDPDQPFFFGKRFAEIIRKHNLGTVMYFGGGSTPLADSTLLGTILGMLGRAGQGGIPSYTALTNNKHSSDWLAFTHANDEETLAVLNTLDRDNSLAWVLGHEANYDVRAITRMRPAAGFDLDTPTDLAIALHHLDIGSNLKQLLNDNEDPLAQLPIEQIVAIAKTPETNLTLIGRVSPQAWQSLNRATQCWIRVFAEERGMVASGRVQRGEVKSLLSTIIEKDGPEAFFATLATMTEAAIIDSRPLMAAAGHWPSDADRFASDLFLSEQIENDWLRAFTEAAKNAPIPVLLGGHNVVAGGLYALIEIIEQR